MIFAAYHERRRYEYGSWKFCPYLCYCFGAEWLRFLLKLLKRILHISFLRQAKGAERQTFEQIQKVSVRNVQLVGQYWVIIIISITVN